jgi:transcriptional regulator with PAS, ATPase and Fis domain
MENPTQVIYDADQPVVVLRSAVLRVVSGPDRGARCELRLSRATVGTAGDNALVLTDNSVSSHHIEVQVRDQGYLVRDLGSTNGTHYQGARVGEALLAPGAELQIGATVLRLEHGEERSQAVPRLESFGKLIGSSPAMQEVYGLLATVAPTDVTVLIEGETGTGKELVAEELHRQSPRRNCAFSVIDCGALPPSLIESELFGHERGAFTGAVRDREGMFERARGGTVFLDEIGELPLELQSKLLRVLDRRVVRRVGGNLERKVDVRLVAATNRDLAEEVRCGRFRQDLYYRLNVFSINIPPLRERRDDIPVLAQYFLDKFNASMNKSIHKISEEAMDFLTKYEWPGNVRELENAIERALVVGKTDSILLEDLPFHIYSSNAMLDDGEKSLSAMEKKHIIIVKKKLVFQKNHL